MAYLRLMLMVAMLGSSGAAGAQDALLKVRFATDWKAQAEQGGFYQAKALGLYEKAGLDVEIRGGGPGINIPQLLGAGAIEFGMGSNSFIPLNIVKAGVPAKAVMAAFQKDPQVLITHPRDDVRSLEDMEGKPIMIADATINAFWVWLRAEYGFSDRQIRKYTFNLAPFLSTKRPSSRAMSLLSPTPSKHAAGLSHRFFCCPITAIRAMRPWCWRAPTGLKTALSMYRLS